MSENPLIQAYKKPAVFVSLPSGAKWYEPKPKLSVDNELAVYPMSARDELLTKTPDALFNGEANIALLESCCPDIENPRQIPVNDLLVLLIAIRQATYGNKFDVDLECPKCKHLNQLTIDSAQLLSQIKEVEFETEVRLESNFKIIVRPYTIEDRTLMQIQNIKRQKMVDNLIASEDDDKTKSKMFGETFVELAVLTIDVITNCIISVQAPESSDVIVDKEMIREWLQNISKKDHDAIKDRVEALSDDGMDTNFKAKCIECSHDWSQEVELDVSNFFVG